MATPMFRDLSRALEAPEEGRELWSGVPADEEPAYAEELFRKASDAALARESALPKEGYVPAGTGPMVEPSLDSMMSPMPSGLRSRKPADFSPDTTRLQGKLAGFLGGDRPLESPIPVANAPSTSDAAAPVTSAIPTTGPRTPAGTPDSMNKGGMVAPSSEGAGGDTSERDLYLARLAAQSAAGFGGMGAGKNIDMGIADTLGERLKQVQALRAKREEQGLEQARERSTWGASNRGMLNSLLAQYKDNPAVSAALMALEPSLETTKPSDFQRASTGAIMTRPKAESIQATTKKTGAQTATEEAKPEVARGTLEVKRGTLAERERSNKANEELRRKALLAKQLSDTKTADEIRAAGSDPKAAERAITRAMETAESDKLGIAGNIRDFQGLETVAPGFTQGKVPSWLGQGSIEAASKVPALNKQASELASALGLFIAGIRKSLFGASLTGNEKEAFDAIVSSGLLMPPDVLAANINRLREGAAKFAQNHFTVAQTLHPEVTSRVLGASSLFGPAVTKGGIYSDVWTLPATPSTTAGAGPAIRPPKPADKPGAKTLWNKKRGTWVQYGPDAEAKARADNAVED